MGVIEKHLFAGRLERVVFPYNRLGEAIDIVEKDSENFVFRYSGQPDLYCFDRKEKSVESKRHSR